MSCLISIFKELIKISNVDDVKEYLNKIRYVDNEINAKEEIKQRMYERLTSIKATQYREIDVQGGIREPNEDRILEYIEYSEHINEFIDDGLYRTIGTE